MSEHVKEFVETSVAMVCSDAIMKVAWIEGVAAGLISGAVCGTMMYLLARKYWRS